MWQAWQGIVLAVGADHSSGIKPQEYDDRFGMLESWARKRWPQAGKRVYEWSGMVRLNWRRPLRGARACIGRGSPHGWLEVRGNVLAGEGRLPVRFS